MHRISYLAENETTEEQAAKNFRQLKVWQLGKSIVAEIYRITKDFPKDELYGLTTQMRRSAVSIPSNVAEGFNRFHNKEYRQFLFISLGSCGELETQIEISHDLQLCKEADYRLLLEKLDHESKMLRKLIRQLSPDDVRDTRYEIRDTKR